MFQFLKTWIVRIFSFLYRSIRRFQSNNGLLLSAAVSYKTLLSFIPLVALLVVGLSFVFPEEKLLEIIRQHVNHLLPGQVDAVLEVAETFLRTRDLVSGIGFLMLLFFSSIGFRVLRDAVKSIFHEKNHRTRRYWITFLIPYMYIGALGLALFAITVLSVLLEELREDGISLFGYVWQFEAAPGIAVHALAFLGLLLIFASLYKVLPVRSVSLKRAFIGGSVAALLWDVTRRGLVFYFNNLSMINVLYGSLATVIVVLVSLEIAAGIVLYGAQITADLEDNASAGNHWYESPDGTY